MTTVQNYKERVKQEIESHKETIVGVSREIHDNPELGLKEYKASELLTTEIEKFGFDCELGVAGLDTAFVAKYEGDGDGPNVGFLAEYDAIPELGHACGHNLIAAASFGAAVGLRKVVHELGGTVTLFGTPDEEGVDMDSRGGKIIMARDGVFDCLDAALMVHPWDRYKVWDYSFPVRDFVVKYVGEPAHYTEPQQGVNALESLLAFLNDVNTMKRNWTPDVMFAYTITDGGGPSAITVPETAEAHVTFKAFYHSYLEELYEKIKNCAANVASSMGAEVRIEPLSVYKSMIPNLGLCSSLYNNFRSFGVEVEHPSTSQRELERRSYPGGSTDFGDVSGVVPGIHGYIPVGEEEIVAHTREFARTAGSRQANENALLGAKSMAMTGVELVIDDEFAAEVGEEFARYKDADFSNVPGIPPDYSEFPKGGSPLSPGGRGLG